MKIIQSCGSLSWGGLEMITLNTSFKLSELGHEVTVLCLPHSKLEKESAELNLRVLPILAKKLNTISSIGKLKNFLNDSQYDIIHTHLSRDLWTIIPAVKLSSNSEKIKLFLTKHMASGVIKRDIFHRMLYKRVNKIFAVSNFVKQSVTETCPVKADDVIVIPDAVSLKLYNPSLYNKTKVKQELKITNTISPFHHFTISPLVIGMVGRMTPGKGHEEFLNAAKLIINKSKLSIRFLIVGSASYGEELYEQKIRSLASKLELNDVIIFTGFRKDIPRILTAVDVLAFPSHEESFGVTLLEAMAMEIPVVASNTAGVLDIVINGKTGILIPAKNPGALANALIGLAENPELRMKLGKEGRRRVENFFNIDNTIKTIVEYYKNDKLNCF